MAMDKKREDRIRKICEGVQKAFGGGNTTDGKIITYLGDEEREPLERFSSGCFELDEALGGGWPRGRMIEIYGPESGGKCHAKGTKILMFDGYLKNVEDIEVGDWVMGPDSTPRQVQALARGSEMMYRVTPRKGLDNSFVVNENHVLCLKNTEIGSKFGEIVDISLKDYMGKSDNFRYYNKLFQVPVEWSEKELPVDPYFLGLWLGDGSSDCVRVYTQDEEVVSALEEYGERIGHSLSVVDDESGRCPGYSLVVGKGKYQSEFCLQGALRSLGVLNNKHIPHIFKTGSRTQRLELLAGLLDSDGYKGASKLVFCNTNKVLAEDVLFVARSLGFFCNLKEYTARLGEFSCPAYKVYINGDCSVVPLRVSRKRPSERESNRDPLVSSFEVESVGVGEFFGFILDGDHRYLMGNFIVQHNTTLCYHAVAEFQKKYPDEDIAWVDSEYALDPEYAEKIGVDISTIIHHEPTDGNQAFEVIRHLIKSGVKLIIVDSVAALSPKEEIEASMEDTQRLGSAARMMSQALRVLVGEVGRAGVTILFTNQVRDKPGVMWGEKTTTPGGRALRFYASIRVDIRGIGQEKDGELVTSMHTKALCKKNKTAPPLRVANFIISFGVGVDRIAGIFDKSVERKVIEKAGAWFSFDGNRLGQGRSASLTQLRENEELLAEVEKKLLAAPAVVVEKKSSMKKARGKKSSTEDEDTEPSPEPDLEVGGDGAAEGTSVDDA